jgi:2-amino-4-hydroxy-6-hydroxymethyldihydropteridine diphosphokinase/dihydroneopterin aldolase
MPDRIELREISARGVIGLGPAERREAQEILVSVLLDADLTRAAESDRIEDTINYSVIKRRIIGYVESSRLHTLEALAGRIARVCLSEPIVESATVRIEKPAAERFARSIAVEITRSRPRDARRRSAFVVLGSNHRAEQTLAAATYKLCAIGRLTGRSAVYQSPSVDSTDARDYLNAAVRIQTADSATEIKKTLKAIEGELGRTHEPDGPVAIDLDLCLLDSEVISTPELELPSPELLTRGHVAATIAEIDPTLVHPRAREALGEIAKRLVSRGPALKRRDDIKLPDL